MSYLDIVDHYEQCYKIYGDNHKGVDWPNWEDTQKRYQVMLDIFQFDREKINTKNTSILDLGCGLGHLYEYILMKKIPYEYEGMDISELFIKECKSKYPEIVFTKQDILSDQFIKYKTWDYVCMNGVFTEKREMTYDEMFAYFRQMIKKAYSLCNRGIAFNVMSKDVDWERDDLFHLPLSELSHFLTGEISRNFIIRNDYGLYEYTTYLYR